MRKLPALAGLSLGAAAAFSGTAHADAEPGSGFGPYSLAASAPAFQVRVSDPNLCFSAPAGVNGCEGVIPESAATLRSGPIGHGLAAVAWPGGIAAGAGSLLITLGGSTVPPQATLVNDPLRADAYTNVGMSTVSNNDVPGSTMTATALPARVTGEGSVSGTTSTPGGSVGSSVSRSGVELTGVSGATAMAHSEVKDVTVAAVVHIASVISDAVAVTNGVAALAKGATKADGITVAGIAVTVDDRGVTALGTTASPAAEQAAVNAALSGAGISMALGAPQGKAEGGRIDYTAQSLVIFWKNPTTFDETVVLGGAHVSVAATPAYVAPALDSPVFVPPVTVVPSVGPPPAIGTTVPAVVPPGTVTVPPVLPPQVVPFTPQASTLPGVGPLRTRTVLLVLGGGFLLAAAFRRLPDRILQRTPVECLYEEQP
jgi:hypothetical protein